MATTETGEQPPAGDDPFVNEAVTNASIERTGPRISGELLGKLLTPALGVKGAQLSLALDGNVSHGRLREIERFVREAHGRSTIDLTVDLSDKTEDFKRRVIEFVDSVHHELLGATINARSSRVDPTLPPSSPPAPIGPGIDPLDAPLGPGTS